MLGFMQVYYLLFMCLMLPYLAVKAHLRDPSLDKPKPPKDKLSVGAVLSLAIIGGIAMYVAAKSGIPLFVPWHPSPSEIVLGLGLLIFWLAVRFAFLDWLRAAPRRRTMGIIPETWSELPHWGLVSLSAGVFEEIAYRWVLYLLVLHFTGLPLVAGFFASLIFAIVHIGQGFRSASFIFVLAVTLQLLVAFAGTFYMAMIVHTTYDFLIGVDWIVNRHHRDEPLTTDSTP